MADILNIVLPVFLIVGLGYAVRWRDLVGDLHIDALMKFALNFAVPALLFRAISTLDLAENFAPDLLISFYTGSITCYFLGIFGARYLFKRNWQDSVAIGFCCLFSNLLMLGLPISERAYGAENLSGNFAIISIHSLICYFLGISVMEIVKAKGKTPLEAVYKVLRGMFRNMLIVAVFAGFAFNFSGFEIPSAVADSLDLLGRTALPVALFAIGGVLRRYKPEGDIRTVLYICVVSLLIHPTIVFSMGTMLELPIKDMRSAVLSASMAPGINAYLFASLYGRAMRVAASAVLIATALSILSVSAWLIILG